MAQEKQGLELCCAESVEQENYQGRSAKMVSE